MTLQSSTQMWRHSPREDTSVHSISTKSQTPTSKYLVISTNSSSVRRGMLLFLVHAHFGSFIYELQPKCLARQLEIPPLIWTS